MKRIVLAIIVLVVSSCRDLSPQMVFMRMHEADNAAASESPEIAHEMYKRLADDCHKAGDVVNESMCLYNMATIYLNQNDTLGMHHVLGRMEALTKANPGNLRAEYDLHSVKSAYYAHLHEGRGDDSSLNAMFAEGRKAIYFQERMSVQEQREGRVNPVWNYYNMAVCFDLFFDPPKRDSISKYLDLARKANTDYKHIGKIGRQSGDISIKDLQAWLYYYDGENSLAEQEMTEVLAIIDSVDAVSPNTILTEKAQAYDFFVELYSSTGQFEKALEYEKLKEETELYRLGVDRNKAVREVEARYDVAKAESRARGMRVTALILAIIVLVLLFVVLYKQLMDREREHERYTAAVEALVEGDPKVRSLTKVVDRNLAKNLFHASLKPLSAVERKYILLFMSGTTTEEIARAMNVDVSSVYTMKYRVKKKFPPDFSLPF